MSIEIDSDSRSKITSCIFQGNKIEAIKIYRENTACGLKEAKEFIEELTETLYDKHPDKFKVKPKAGCGTAVLIVIAVCILYFLS